MARIQVAPLGDPGNIRVPNAVNIPQAAVQRQAGGASLAGLSEALSGLNPAIQNLGGVLINKAAKEGAEAGAVYAIENPEKVAQNMFPEGANPWFIVAGQEQFGEAKAVTDYEAKLRETMAKVTDPLNGEDMDTAIANVRKEFFGGLGDNFYVKKGAAAVIPQVEQRFRTEAVRERTALVEQKARESASIVGVQLAKNFVSKLNNGDTEAAVRAKQEIADHINKLAPTVKNYKQLYVNNVVKAVALDLVDEDPMKAMKYISTMRSLELSDNGAVFGQAGDINLALDEVEQEVTRLSYQKSERDNILKRRADDEYEKKAEGIILGIIQAGVDTGKPLTDTNLKQMIGQLREETKDRPDLFTRLRSKLETQFSGARNRQFVSDPDTVYNLQALIRNGESLETAEPAIRMAKDEGRLSPADATRLFGELDQAVQINQFERAPQVDRGIQGILNAARAAIKEGELDPLAYQTLPTDLEDSYRRILKEEILAEKAKGGTTAEIRNRMLDVYARVNNKAFDAAMGVIQERKKEAAVRMAQPLSSEQVFNIDPKIVAATKKAQQLILGASTPELRSKAVKYSEANRASIKRSIDTTVEAIKSGVRMTAVSAGVGAPGILQPVALSQQEVETQRTTYFQLKSIYGYTPVEIVRGVTEEGIRIDFKELPKDTPFVAPLFPNMNNLRTTYDNWLKDPTNKDSIMSRMLQQLGIDAANKPQVEFFIEKQIEYMNLRP